MTVLNVTIFCESTVLKVSFSGCYHIFTFMSFNFFNNSSAAPRGGGGAEGHVPPPPPPEEAKSALKNDKKKTFFHVLLKEKVGEGAQIEL